VTKINAVMYVLNETNDQLTWFGLELDKNSSAIPQDQEYQDQDQQKRDQDQDHKNGL